MGKMKTYEAVFDENTAGVFGISLVENPATEEHFIKLSEDEKVIQLATIDEEQRILLGLVLEPNVPIYRNQGGEEFNLVFNNETVKSLAHGFLKNGNQKNSTIEHDNDRIEGIAFVESWIVDDPKKDKSNSYGVEYQKGSWLVSMKVDSDEIWNDYVKTGKVKGFSIDAVVKLREVNNNKKDVKMSLKETVLKAASNFAIKMGNELDPDKAKEAEVKMGSAMLEDGSLTFEWDGEMPEAGVSVFVYEKGGEDEKIPVPEGKYPLENGEVLVVAEEGIIAEVVKPESEKDEEVAVVEEEEAEPAQAIPTPPTEEINKIQSILIKYEENQVKMSEQLEALSKKIDSADEKIVSFSEQPSRKPAAPVQSVKLNAQGRVLEKLRANK